MVHYLFSRTQIMGLLTLTSTASQSGEEVNVPDKPHCDRSREGRDGRWSPAARGKLACDGPWGPPREDGALDVKT